MAQSWSPERYARHARFVSDLGQPVLDLLSPVHGERILDVGCGDGVLTEKIAAAGCTVVGVDASAEQVAGARQRGIDAYVLDANELAYDAEFDAVFSNAALHWLTEPQRVVSGVWRALKSGGRFVGEMGGGDNVAAVVAAFAAALQRRRSDARQFNPWYFPSDSEYRQRLESQGFEVLSVQLIQRPTPIPGDVGDWLQTFAESFLQAVTPAERQPLIDEVRTLLRPALYADDGTWTIDYVRLRFSARKPN